MVQSFLPYTWVLETMGRWTHILAVGVFCLYFWKGTAAATDLESPIKPRRIILKVTPKESAEESPNCESALETHVPESTYEERSRFLTATKGDVNKAVASLKAYLSWRLAHQQSVQFETTDDSDWNDWNRAAAVALQIMGYNPQQLPRTARTFIVNTSTISCRKGHTVLQITPGIMDDRLAPLTVYSLAIALYVDYKLQRNSLDRLTVLIDSRGGKGWRNRNAAHLLTFIQHTCHLLLSYFPERLGRAIVYPVPAAFGWVWSLCRRCIDPVTTEKIHLVCGTATIAAAPPAQLSDFIEPEHLDYIEKQRIESFVVS